MLDVLKSAFKYWHVVHVPFTIIMFVLFLIHVLISVLLGYKWVF